MGDSESSEKNPQVINQEAAATSEPSNPEKKKSQAANQHTATASEPANHEPLPTNHAFRSGENEAVPRKRAFRSGENGFRQLPPAASYRGAWYRPLPAYLYSWVSILLLKPSSLAIIMLTFSEYLVEIFYVSCSDVIADVSAVKLFACCGIILITFINSYSVTLATKVQNVFTAAKLLAILVIVAGGVVKLAQGNTQYLATGFQGSTSKLGDVATAFYSGLWAYDGWNNLNYVTEELKKPYT
ncbi:Amino acid/polyamine transporter I [Trinorchestia longiramus]|nr:Amino acid/polyamine transporter I [Trinorchestia longiramus]